MYSEEGNTVAMTAVRDCGFEQSCHLPYSQDLAPCDQFLSPNVKKLKPHLAGQQYQTDDEVISAVKDFLRTKMRASIPRKSKHCNTDGRSVRTAGETMLKNKPHLVKFDHCIIISLGTFQPTLGVSSAGN